MNQEDIAKLIPHTGNMCLLEKIINWNETTLKAQTYTHLKLDNPLRTNDKLKSIHGIEYAAQAMAVHGALLDKKCQNGYIGSIRNVVVNEAYLPTRKSPLDIHVQALMRSKQGFIYNFSLQCTNQLIISGKITIFLF